MMWTVKLAVSKVMLYVVVSLVQVQGCYWNSRCTYALFGSKTPYDTIRGDIRDYPLPENCEPISMWNLIRHGNRNPGGSVTDEMREVASLKHEIIASHEAGDSKLCSQDIENFKKWHWNETLEVSHSYLTGTGYEELYGIGKRIREKYIELINGSLKDFSFTPTNEQRTITSCMAFIQGITEGLNLNVTVDTPGSRDDIVRAYGNCDRYQQEVKVGQLLTEHLQAYFQSTEYVSVLNAVQDRLGLKTQLDATKLFSIYELCRFYRSWSANLQSPWCAAFSDKDLVLLEDHDDIRHYYRNGYGSWVNVNLGKTVLKDLYDTFESAINGNVKKVVSYFTHDTTLEMTLSALGLYQGDKPLQSTLINDHRVWRTSFFGAFASNIIAILNSCNDGGPTHRVQLFINEKETEICPLEGCSWQEFQDKFQDYTHANLEFCSMDYEQSSPDKAISTSGTSINRILSWSRKNRRLNLD